jgi:regulator of protease activity HflC (stomatin/prohibitin superfamily)
MASNDKIAEFLNRKMSPEAQARLDAFNARMAAERDAKLAAQQAEEAWQQALVESKRADRLAREAEQAAEAARITPVAEQSVEPSNRPATDRQLWYLRKLGVSITDLTEPHLTVARASELISAAKGEYLESIGGCYTGTVDAHD